MQFRIDPAIERCVERVHTLLFGTNRVALELLRLGLSPDIVAEICRYIAPAAVRCSNRGHRDAYRFRVRVVGEFAVGIRVRVDCDYTGRPAKADVIIGQNSVELMSECSGLVCHGHLDCVGAMGPMFASLVVKIAEIAELFAARDAKPIIADFVQFACCAKKFAPRWWYKGLAYPSLTRRIMSVSDSGTFTIHDSRSELCAKCAE